MNVTDIVLLLIGGFFIVRGIMKGFTGEIISLVSTVGGFFCATKFYGPIAGILTEKLAISQIVATILAMLGIFFVIFFGCFYLELSVKKVLEKTKLTSTDKFLGACVGFIKFYVITLMVLIVGHLITPMMGDDWMKSSNIIVIADKTWPLVYPMLDKAGLIPDFESIQTETKEYVIRQAGSTLLGASADLSGMMRNAVIPVSGDVMGEDLSVDIGL
jgi:membrane protein required for colicin V production